MAATRTTWVGGTVFGAVVALAGGWVLGISPLLDAAAESDTQRVEVEAQNAVLQGKIVQLKAQFENLDQFKAEVQALEVQIPPTADLADYLREMSTLAEAQGAFIVSVKPGVPLSVSDAAESAASAAASTTAPAATPEPTATEDATASEEATEPTVTAAPTAPAIPGFVAIPVDINLLGSVANVANAMTALQTSSTRLFVITSITGKGTDAAEASEGKPATNEGDLDLTITGYIYVVQAPAVAPVPEDETAPALPGGDLGKTLSGA